MVQEEEEEEGCIRLMHLCVCVCVCVCSDHGIPAVVIVYQWSVPRICDAYRAYEHLFASYAQPSNWLQQRLQRLSLNFADLKLCQLVWIRERLHYRFTFPLSSSTK